MRIDAYETLRIHALQGEEIDSTFYRIIGEWQSGKHEYEELSQEVQRLRGVIEKERQEAREAKENATPLEMPGDGRTRADYVDELYELREALRGALQVNKYLCKYADF